MGALGSTAPTQEPTRKKVATDSSSDQFPFRSCSPRDRVAVCGNPAEKLNFRRRAGTKHVSRTRTEHVSVGVGHCQWRGLGLRTGTAARERDVNRTISCIVNPAGKPRQYLARLPLRGCSSPAPPLPEPWVGIRTVFVTSQTLADFVLLNYGRLGLRRFSGSPLVEPA